MSENNAILREKKRGKMSSLADRRGSHVVVRRTAGYDGLAKLLYAWTRAESLRVHNTNSIFF
jgi:hypothetical protein